MPSSKPPCGLSSYSATLFNTWTVSFSAFGGPYTAGALIAAFGPGPGLPILILAPLIWSLPEVLIIGELVSMLLEEGG